MNISVQNSYGTNPTWPLENDKGIAGEFGSDPTWPKEPVEKLTSSWTPGIDKFTYNKEIFKETLRSGAGLIGILGIAGAGVGIAGAAALGAPIVIAAGIGGIAGAAAGYGLTGAIMNWIKF